MNPVKVKFKKNPDGKIYESDGYYENEKDFNSRNGTLLFVNLTNKTKPPKKEKPSK